MLEVSNHWPGDSIEHIEAFNWPCKTWAIEVSEMLIWKTYIWWLYVNIRILGKRKWTRSSCLGPAELNGNDELSMLVGRSSSLHSPHQHTLSPWCSGWALSNYNPTCPTAFLLLCLENKTKKSTMVPCLHLYFSFCILSTSLFVTYMVVVKTPKSSVLESV